MLNDNFSYEKKLLSVLLIFSFICYGQKDNSNVLRAFPITGNILDLTDCSKLVQLEIPAVVKLKDQQIGLLWGTYEDEKEETVQKGYGKCYLIKGNY